MEGRWGMGEWVGERCGRDGGCMARWGAGQVGGLKHAVGGVDRATHLLEKQWAADTTQQVWTRLPAQKLFPM